MSIYTIAELRAKIDELEALGDKTLCVAITSALDIQGTLQIAGVNVSLETADGYLEFFSDAFNEAYEEQINRALQDFADQEECEEFQLEPEICECRKWTIGESRCSCGSRRIYLTEYVDNIFGPAGD